MPGEHDAPAEQVDLVEGQLADGPAADVVRRGERDDQPLGGAGDGVADAGARGDRRAAPRRLAGRGTRAAGAALRPGGAAAQAAGGGLALLSLRMCLPTEHAARGTVRQAACPARANGCIGHSSVRRRRLNWQRESTVSGRWPRWTGPAVVAPWPREVNAVRSRWRIPRAGGLLRLMPSVLTFPLYHSLSRLFISSAHWRYTAFRLPVRALELLATNTT